MKKNELIGKVEELLKREKAKGKLLDVGAGDGDLAFCAKQAGFDVTAIDLDKERFKHHSGIEFKSVDLNSLPFPFEENSFDFVVCLEVLEHLENPQEILREFRRILKKQGTLIASTPNILSLKSRLRFLFEGSYEYFREPSLEQLKDPKSSNLNIHITPLRVHELEYMLHKNGFEMKKACTSAFYSGLRFLFLFRWICKLQMFLKCRRAKKKGNIDYSRISKIILSPEIFYGKHLIVEAKKS